MYKINSCHQLILGIHLQISYSKHVLTQNTNDMSSIIRAALDNTVIPKGEAKGEK